MIKAGSSFEIYRKCYESGDREQGIEAEGSTELEYFNEAVNDSESTNLTLGNVTLPLLTNSRHLPWINRDFYGSLGIQKQPMFYYSHLSRALAGNREDYSQTIQSGLSSLAHQRGVVIFDSSDHEAERTDEEVDDLLGGVGIDYRDLIVESGLDARHFHYASLGVREDEARTRLTPFSFYDAYSGAKQNGCLNGYESVEVVGSFNKDESEKVWAFYDPVHAGISKVDPVYAGFNETDLDNILESDEFVKLVYRAGKTIVNVCVVTDVRNCSWLNQFYYGTNYPEVYDSGQVVCGVGLLSNPDVKEKSVPSLQTMGMVGKLVNFANADVVFTFANNSISNLYVPRLTQRALGDAKMKTDFSKPLSHQVFRALELGPAE